MARLATRAGFILCALGLAAASFFTTLGFLQRGASSIVIQGPPTVVAIELPGAPRWKSWDLKITPLPLGAVEIADAAPHQYSGAATDLGSLAANAKIEVVATLSRTRSNTPLAAVRLDLDEGNRFDCHFDLKRQIQAASGPSQVAASITSDSQGQYLVSCSVTAPARNVTNVRLTLFPALGNGLGTVNPEAVGSIILHYLDVRRQ